MWTGLQLQIPIQKRNPVKIGHYLFQIGNLLVQKQGFFCTPRPKLRSPKFQNSDQIFVKSQFNLSKTQILRHLGGSLKKHTTLLMSYKGQAEMVHQWATLRFYKIFSILTLKKTLKLKPFTLTQIIVTLSFELFTYTLVR